jgi:hypothetical protein
MSLYSLLVDIVWLVIILWVLGWFFGGATAPWRSVGGRSGYPIIGVVLFILVLVLLFGRPHFFAG